MFPILPFLRLDELRFRDFFPNFQTMVLSENQGISRFVYTGQVYRHFIHPEKIVNSMKINGRWLLSRPYHGMKVEDVYL